MTPAELQEGRELADLTPDELIEKWDGLAVAVAQKNYHRIPAYAYEDLLQMCRIALWRAYQEWDEGDGVPWRLYATRVIRNQAEEVCMYERRRGLTRLGDVASRRKRLNYTGPKIHNLADRDGWVPQELVRKDNGAVDELLDVLRKANVSNRVVDIVELMTRCDLSQSQVARYVGVSRQRVGQLLSPVRNLLRDMLQR